MKDRFGFDWSKIKGTQFWRSPHVGRRTFFRHLATALSGYYLLPSRPMENIAKAAMTPIGTAKNCIFVLLTGAPSHIDTFDLKEGAWTPSFFNPTSYGDLRFPQGLMPNLANQLDSIALVRSSRAWATAHGIAQTWVQIGRNPVSGLSKIAPHIGSVVAMELGAKPENRTLPPFISLNAADGPGAGYFPPDDAPFYVSPNGAGITNATNPSGSDVLDRRYGMKLEIDAELEADPQLGPATADVYNMNLSARRLMYNNAVTQVFNFDQTTRNSYGNSSFGNACITARNLLRSNLGTRFIQISFGSWDHHVNIYAPNSNLQSMAKQFDSGLGSLIADLKADGTLDQTLIVAMGEFGRTVGPLNLNAGRDHHLQQTAFFAGAKVRGMRAIGATDSTGAAIKDPGWSRGREIKPEDIEATIYSALGIDWTTVRRDDPFNRGFEYVPFSEQDLYGPINELWA
ncbi:MAG TPA: DUF1501 domain-containing protein [Bryobacteraceae bacterium]